mmetsp:Transcript_38429/g.44051  ORF Transcript_38429/g.44051 Transcript_38429/m.44051 type:complete len:94 (+) Transcript_38429:518-799(+)
MRRKDSLWKTSERRRSLRLFIRLPRKTSRRTSRRLLRGIGRLERLLNKAENNNQLPPVVGRRIVKAADENKEIEFDDLNVNKKMNSPDISKGK